MAKIKLQIVGQVPTTFRILHEMQTDEYEERLADGTLSEYLEEWACAWVDDGAADLDPDIGGLEYTSYNVRDEGMPNG
jgi:hypothetical protein